jgi:DNA-binding beta-propeller fold protein YncE
MRVWSIRSLTLAAVVVGCDGSEAAKPPVDARDPVEFARAPRACVYDCPQTDCPDLESGYVCPSLGDYATIPHETECAAPTTPAAVNGKCAASAPSGEAAKYTGPLDEKGDTKILPDGRRVRPAGAEHAFVDKDLSGGLPTAVIAIPGTRRVIAVDTGYGPHVVRSIDLDKVGVSDPVISKLRFDKPKTLNSGLAFVAPDLVYVATSDGVAQAMKLDASGVLTLDEARTIKLPPGRARDGSTIPWHVASLAASPDGKRLVLGAVIERRALVYDVEAGSATFGTKLSEIDLGAAETFAVAFDPNDSAHAYVSLWGSRAVAELDLASGAVRKFPTDKSPQGIVALDARWLAVANAHGDTISLIDRVAGSVTAIPIDVRKQHGFDPSNVAWDATRKRLYATIAGQNAVAAWEIDASSTPPKVTPVGRIPTGWWPGAVAALDDGTLAITNMRAAFTGANPTVYPTVDDGDVMGRTYGSIQRVPSTFDLAGGEAAVKSNNEVFGLAGAPKVECSGAAWDFPIPRTNTEGKSKLIEHVFFIVRENKTFDGLLGDLPGVNGDAKLILGKDSATQDRIWANLRALAKDFTVSDNYYTDAELSQQGHFWTVYGRSSDYNERTWAIEGYTRNIRGLILPTGGVLDIGQPVEGSSFDWLGRNGIGLDIFGEALGVPREKAPGPNPVDVNYPGGFIQSIGHPDVEKACHILGRARVVCDVRSFAYITLPNDHTVGVSATSPTPDSMIAVNDEATGMLVEGITKSAYWPKSLIIITEDDPANGGEHVDIHRTPLVMISPWMKRNYVSKTHIDVSSLHKIFAHVFGLPYPNLQVEGAAIPWDAFTSTPDFKPWDRKKRTWPVTCGGTASKAEALLTESFDLDRVDESPGLMRQVERWLKGKPLMSLPPEVEAAARARIAAKKAGAPPIDDDD